MSSNTRSKSTKMPTLECTRFHLLIRSPSLAFFVLLKINTVQQENNNKHYKKISVRFLIFDRGSTLSRGLVWVYQCCHQPWLRIHGRTLPWKRTTGSVRVRGNSSCQINSTNKASVYLHVWLLSGICCLPSYTKATSALQKEVNTSNSRKHAVIATKIKSATFLHH